MGDNLRIRKLQDDLVKTLNESNLPFEVLLLVVEKLHIEIKQKADILVLQEAEVEKQATALKEGEKNGD